MRSTAFLIAACLCMPLCRAQQPAVTSAQQSSVPGTQNAGVPVTNRVVAPIDSSQLFSFRGNVHPLALSPFDQGATPVSTPTGRITLLLQRSAAQQRALSQYLSDLKNPASPGYHKWLTPAQYGAAFGISDSDLQSVEGWLQAQGFTIEKVPGSRNVVEFSGSVDQIQSAFHTSIHTFLVNDERHFANVSDPQIPAALAPVIAGVWPLNDFHAPPSPVPSLRGRYDASTRRIVPELSTTNIVNRVYLPFLLVTPADAATIYDTPNSALNPAYSGPTYDGTGVSIGIAGISDLTLADVANFRMAFLGETPGNVNLPTVVIEGSDPGLTGAGAEALGDTETAGGLAPKAKIYYYAGGNSLSGLQNAIFRALDDNKVSILSVSFHDCEAGLGTTGNQIMLEAAEQAAAQGITRVNSSEDAGSAGCENFNSQSQAVNGFAVNGLASPPYTVAAGGTDFDVLSTSFSSYVSTSSEGAPPYYRTALGYIPENPWNESTTTNTTYSNNVAYVNSQGIGNIYAGGGGVSSVYAKPAYQTAVTPNDGFRDLPDISLLAGTGQYGVAWAICSDNVTDGVTTVTYTECQTTNGQLNSNASIAGGGGTSAAAPAFAGMLALVAQAHGSPSDNYRLGEVNNTLYQLAQSKYATVFHDITTGNNSVPCRAGTANCGSNLFLTGYNAGPGYDLASGLGSVDVAAMVANWTSVSLAATSTSLTINNSTAPYTGALGQTLTFNVGVSPATATGVVAIVDDADEVSGGVGDDGQFAIGLSGGAGSSTYKGLPVGSYTVWARYVGDTANASSTSSPHIQVTVSGIILSSGGNIQVSAGATNGSTSLISAKPYSYTGTVNLSCVVNTNLTNPTHPPSCSFSPASLSIAGTTAVTSTLTVSTTAPTTAALAPGPFRIGGWTTLLALLVWFGIPSKRRAWSRIGIVVALAISISAIGCGGGSTAGGGHTGTTVPGTTAGAYSVVVTATDASAGTTLAQTTVNLTVN